jgi:hypothetical protein
MSARLARFVIGPQPGKRVDHVLGSAVPAVHVDAEVLPYWVPVDAAASSRIHQQTFCVWDFTVAVQTWPDADTDTVVGLAVEPVVNVRPGSVSRAAVAFV